MRHNQLLPLALLAALSATAFSSLHAAPSAKGERSWTKATAAPQWRLARFPAAKATEVRYAEMPVKRLYELQRRNATQYQRATQIGIGRRASLESNRAVLPALKWQPVAGGDVARLQLHSPDALALRVGLRIDRLDDRVELRFAGSDEPQKVVAMMRGDEIKRLAAAGDGMFWTPSTDGEIQYIEIFRPAGVRADGVRVQAPELSHLVANSRNDFKIIEKIGESGTCNVDTSCRVAELGQNFVNAKNAVAHMVFVNGGSSYICTGTLLADTTASTQVPYFYSANHCFADKDGNAVPSAMQTVASTLSTYWNYEATSCGSGVSTQRTQLVGGAAYLYSDKNIDAMLLRLNRDAPVGAFFAGWSAAPLAAGTAVIAIHHPKGDAKKVSSGQVMGQDADNHEIAWLSGTTEGGSSGSGLFVPSKSGYELRGGLFGGSASCSNTGSTANTANRDYYSRLDVAFPNIKQYLAADDVVMNGAKPLTYTRPAPAGAPAMSGAPVQPATRNVAPARAVRDEREGTQPKR